MSTRPLVDCFTAHRALTDRALSLARRLPARAGDQADLLRMGAACLQLAAGQALAARDEREAIRGWNQCAMGDRQIRHATYHSLARGHIENLEYDQTFSAAIFAARLRLGELERLRHRVHRLSLI